MEEILIELLESFGYPVIRQGSLGPAEAYPETFITYWNTDDTEHSAYDNATASADVSFQIAIYSTSPTTAYNTLKAARDLLKENGWTPTTRAYDTASDEVTHIGRGFQVVYLQTENL